MITIGKILNIFGNAFSNLGNVGNALDIILKARDLFKTPKNEDKRIVEATLQDIVDIDPDSKKLVGKIKKTEKSQPPKIEKKGRNIDIIV